MEIGTTTIPAVSSAYMVRARGVNSLDEHVLIQRMSRNPNERERERETEGESILDGCIALKQVQMGIDVNPTTTYQLEGGGLLGIPTRPGGDRAGKDIDQRGRPNHIRHFPAQTRT